MTEAKDVAVLEPDAGATFRALVGDRASPAIQIMLDDRLWERCTQIAARMSRAQGVIPRHLIGCQEACFAVVCQSMTWKLDPHAVARCTYQTPGGSMGFMGSLCQAILENSGRIKGQIKFEHFGDWDKIQGKFKIKDSAKGGKYPAADWPEKDEDGLGVIVSAQIIGEDEPRTFRFLLKQAFPRNSTLWATDPMTQICYTAIRRFSSVAAPAIFMGVPFDREDMDELEVLAPIKDVTPARPAKVTRKAADAASAEMDAGFKQTVGSAAAQAPAPAETVIEDEAHQERNDHEPEATEAHDEETGEVSPQPEQAKPQAAQKTQPVQKPQTVQQSVGDPRPEPTPVDEAKPAPKPEPQPFTAAEMKAFKAMVEKGVVASSDTIALDSLKARIRPEFKRLKATDEPTYENLIAMITNKDTFLRNQESDDE